MDRQPPAVYIVSLLAEQVKKLRIYHADKEVKGAVCIAHNQEQCGFSVAQSVQFQLIVGGDLPQFGE